MPEVEKRLPRSVVGGDLCGFSPNSLAGSYYLRVEGYDQEVAERGLIVGEPQPGVYLLEVTHPVSGQATHQRLEMLERMLSDEADWRFYDSPELMAGAAKLLEEASKCAL